jgi:hypothetical protein
MEKSIILEIHLTLCVTYEFICAPQIQDGRMRASQMSSAGRARTQASQPSRTESVRARGIAYSQWACKHCSSSPLLPQTICESFLSAQLQIWSLTLLLLLYLCDKQLCELHMGARNV